MNNMWSDNRSRMLEQNMKARITCKINTDFSCYDFYENIKSDKFLEESIVF